MNKKLPSVFQNKIDKKIDNNEHIYYSDNKKEEKEIKRKIKTENKKLGVVKDNVRWKIKELFSSSNYIYKLDVVIKLKDKEIKKRIIGRNKNNLITIDNELISINDIIDINLENDLSE